MCCVFHLFIAILQKLYHIMRGKATSGVSHTALRSIQGWENMQFLIPLNIVAQEELYI